MSETGERVATFESWAVLELFGHKQLAGKVSEQTIGGCAFVRVDVPATTDRPAYTKFLGNGAIYSITPCSEEVARLAAHEVERWNNPLPLQLPKALPAAAASGEVRPSLVDDLDLDDEDDEAWTDGFDGEG